MGSNPIRSAMTKIEWYITYKFYNEETGWEYRQQSRLTKLELVHLYDHLVSLGNRKVKKIQVHKRKVKYGKFKRVYV
jgi:hypothetical protein